MATVEQRQFERLQDKISGLYTAISRLESEVDELNILADATDKYAGDNVKLSCDTPGYEYDFTKLEAAKAFDLFEQIGMNPARRYSLIEIEEIRLAVERILR